MVPAKNFVLPSSLFHSSSLRIFKFSGSLCHNFYWPSSSRLPSLQILHLSRINFTLESSDNIISSCQSCLKELSLENCSGVYCLTIDKCCLLEDLNIQHCVGLQQLGVSAKRLRKFRIVDSFDASTCIKTLFAICAPNLESFIWSDLLPFLFSSVGSISSICHSSIKYPTTSKASIETMVGALNLLLKLCDSRKLSMNAACISVLCAGAHGRLRNGKEIHKFNNTEDLKAVIDFGWQVAELSSLLRSCPNLKKLEITNTQIISSSGYACNLDIGGYWGTQGLCLSHLMEVKLLEFKGTAYEVDLIELLIQHVRTLQRLTIKTSVSVPLCVRSNVAQILTTVPSASPKLRLLFL